MAPRKGSSPFSQVKSTLLLDPNKRWYVLSNLVCSERPSKYFSMNKLPSRFPEDFVRLKRSALQTVDGKPLSLGSHNSQGIIKTPKKFVRQKTNNQ